MATQYKLQNAAINGIAARDITFPIPEEGEIFRDFGNNQIMYMKGGQIYQLPSAVDTFSQDQRNEWGRGGYNLERMQQLANEQFLQQAGIDYGGDINTFIQGLRTQNMGDLQTAGLVKVQGQQGQVGRATPQDFKSVYNAYKLGNFGQAKAPTETLTGPGAQTFQQLPQPIQPVQPQVLGTQAGQPAQGQTYTVQAGDTLSAIAQRMGVNVNQITGYRSGNPNLIYPGEVLTVGGGGSQQVDTRKYIQDPNNPNASIPNPNYGKPIFTPTQGQTPTTGATGGAGEEAGAGAGAGEGAGAGAGAGTGAGAGEEEIPETPSPSDFISQYKAVLEELGIKSIKDKFDEIVQQETDLQNELNDEISDVQENPWLSEAARRDGIKHLQEKYQGKLDILTNKQTLYNALYEEGVAEAKFLTTGQTEQNEKLLDIATRKAEALADLKDNIVEMQGGLWDLEKNAWIIQPKEEDAMDKAIKQAQLAKIKKETSLLGEPTEKEKKETEEAIKNAEASIPIMQDKVKAIDDLLKSSGLNSRVGTTAITRKAVPQWYNPLTWTGTIDDLTGAGKSFAAGVHRLVSGLSLDALVQAKAQGATFGALSDAELQMLANSASSINDWEIKKDNVGTGIWQIDEKSFKAELNRIKELTNKAILRSQGSLLSPEEQEVLDNMFNNQNASSFY